MIGNTNATSIEHAYPVGSIYMNASNSTNPGTLLGFGTWQELAPGRVLMGAGNSDYTAGNEYGEYSHTLTTAEMPSHGHSVSIDSTNTDHVHGTGDAGWGETYQGPFVIEANGAGSGGASYSAGTLASSGLHEGWINGVPSDNDVASSGSSNRSRYVHVVANNHNHGNTGGMSTNASHGHTVNQSNVGGGGAHNNVQPSLVVYMWVRTA